MKTIACLLTALSASAVFGAGETEAQLQADRAASLKAAAAAYATPAARAARTAADAAIAADIASQLVAVHNWLAFLEKNQPDNVGQIAAAQNLINGLTHRLERIETMERNGM